MGKHIIFNLEFTDHDINKPKPSRYYYRQNRGFFTDLSVKCRPGVCEGNNRQKQKPESVDRGADRILQTKWQPGERSRIAGQHLTDKMMDQRV